MSYRIYHYVGPQHILEHVAGQPPGEEIRSPDDVLDWIEARDAELDREGQLTVTFVVTTAHVLRIADRHSEHVACAGQQPVLAAGEMIFEVDGAHVEVVGVSNQSTGYCPEPDCWEVIAQALDHADLARPEALTGSFIFRMCEHCGQRNIVKEQWFECAVCQSDLPESWNFG